MILTTTAKIKSEEYKLIPVKTTGKIPVDSLSDAMKIVNKLNLVPPIHLGQVLIENFLLDGVSLVATKTILK